MFMATGVCACVRVRAWQCVRAPGCGVCAPSAWIVRAGVVCVCVHAERDRERDRSHDRTGDQEAEVVVLSALVARTLKPLKLRIGRSISGHGGSTSCAPVAEVAAS